MERSRAGYDEALNELHQRLLNMSSRVERMITDAITSLAQSDIELAKQVIDADDAIDRFEFELEDACIRLIALQQPLAGDLRNIAATFKVVGDIERMGDYSVNIAEVTLHIASEGLIKPLVDLPRMAQMTQAMVTQALDAFVRVDLDLARRVCDRDDDVDALYSELYDELCGIAATESAKAPQAIHLIMVARQLERIADHATNIAERAIYLKTGRHEKAVSKRETGKWGA